MSASQGVTVSGHQYYEHSGSFSPVMLVVGVVGGALASLLLAWLYAYGIFYIPFIYINFVLTLGLAFGLAFLAVYALRFGRVRNGTVFAVGAGIIALAAFYAHWAAWVGLLLRRSGVEVMGLDVAANPGALWAVVRDINAVGAWSLFGAEVNGLALWAIWGIEAAMILGGAVLLAVDMFSDLPFCENCESWCKKHSNVARVWEGDGQPVAEAIQNRDLDALQNFGTVASDAEDGSWFEFDLEMCPECGSTNTIDVRLVAAQKNEKGETAKDESDIISNLLVSAEEARMIRALGGATV